MYFSMRLIQFKQRGDLNRTKSPTFIIGSHNINNIRKAGDTVFMADMKETARTLTEANKGK